MEYKKRTVQLIIRRYENEDPIIIKKTIEIAQFIDYNTLKSELQRICDVNEGQVMKIRNSDGILVPISFLADSDERTFYIDIANISCAGKTMASLLQDAYVDAVQQKIRSLESRIAQSELLLPQLEWRRQAYMEDTVSALLNKVAFLNRRFDELLPQFRAKIPETMA